MSVAKDDVHKATDSFDEAVEELQLAVFGMQPDETLAHATIGQFSDSDHMDKKIAGKFYWEVVFETRRTVGVDTGAARVGNPVHRQREALRKVTEAIAAGRAALRQKMRTG